MRILSKGIIWLLGFGLLATLPWEAAGDSWPIFHGDRRHSGFTENDAPFDSLLAWTRVLGDSILYSSPVVAPDGTVYIGTLGEELVAVSLFGGEMWRFQGEGNFRHSTPAIAPNGRIYIGGSDGQLYAINPSSTLAWTYQAGGAIKTSPNIGPDGTIYFGADDGRLYAVYPDSTERWTYATGDTIRSSPAIANDGTILFGSHDHYLYALWPNGTLRWRAATGDIIKYCSPAVSEDGIVYYGSYDGFLYSVTLDQELLWYCDTGHVLRSSPAIGIDGRVYIGSGTKLLAINQDGDIEWDCETYGTVTSSPVYFEDDDVVCVGSASGVFYCVHADDGHVDWTFTVESPILSSPAPNVGNIIHIADVSGALWAFGNLPDLGIDDDLHITTSAFTALPNPARHGVVFRPNSDDVAVDQLIIFDLLGRQIAELPAAGQQILRWDGCDLAGRPVAAGVYLYGHSVRGPLRRVVLTR